MRVHCDEGVATHVAPDPCAVLREDDCEASAGERKPDALIGHVRIWAGGGQQWPSLPRNAEQTSKRTMCRPTRTWNRGRLARLGDTSEDYAQPLHRGSGGSMYTRKAHATRETPTRDQG